MRLKLEVAKIRHDERVVCCSSVLCLQDQLDTARVVRFLAPACHVDAAALEQERFELHSDLQIARVPVSQPQVVCVQWS
jgi:hypothetical protein